MRPLELIAHCVWLNMYSRQQNPTITPWDFRFIVVSINLLHERSDLTIMVPVFLIKKTGIPIKKALEIYAMWGEAEHVLRVLHDRRWGRG